MRRLGKWLVAACAVALLGAGRAGAEAVQTNAGPAGVAAVSFSLSSASASPSFIPVPGRTFHVELTAGTGSATCELARQLDGTNWVAVTIQGTPFPVLAYTGAALSEDLFEAQAGVPWRLDCGAAIGAYTSGTIAGQFSE